MLVELGFKPGKADGVSGHKTRSAVRAFQQTQSKLPATGILDHETLRLLRFVAETVRQIKVREAQSLLKQLGYDPGSIDGAFGPKTRLALRTLQADQGISNPSVAISESLLALLRQKVERKETLGDSKSGAALPDQAVPGVTGEKAGQSATADPSSTTPSGSGGLKLFSKIFADI